MSNVFSRRNAVVGWLALTLGRRALKQQKKKEAKAKKHWHRPGRKTFGMLLVGAAGAVMFWKTRSDGDGGADGSGDGPDAGPD
jgi:hypothetical protein